MTWRDTIKIHPTADLFPLLDEADLVTMGNDIKANGLTSPIAIRVDNDKATLCDGRNRLDAMEIVGLRVNLENTRTAAWKLTAEEELDGKWVGLPIARHSATVTVITGDPTAYIVSANIHRRHLTIMQKKELTAALLKEDPERSNRSIGELVKLDHKTVGAVRQKEEARGEIPHVDKVVDIKGRQQPATRPNREKPDVIPDGYLWSEKKRILYRKPNPPYWEAARLQREAEAAKTPKPAVPEQESENTRSVFHDAPVASTKALLDATKQMATADAHQNINETVVEESTPRDLDAREIVRQMQGLVDMLRKFDPWPMGKWDGLPANAQHHERWSSKKAYKDYTTAIRDISSHLDGLRREYEAQLKKIEKAKQAKTGIDRQPVAADKLAWQQTDTQNVLIRGKTEYYNHTAETAAGTYHISANAEFPSMAFGGYSVSFRPTGAKHLEDGHDVGGHWRKLEDAKESAQRDYDRRVKARVH
jgi:hypothetical protein